MKEMRKRKNKTILLPSKSKGGGLRSVLILFSILFSIILLLPAATDLFSVQNLQSSFPDSRRLYDRYGTLLREAVNAEGARAKWVSREGISSLVIEATIAVEDQRFYSHRGVDVLALGRALWQDFSRGYEVSGASTITMQLVRLLFKYGHDLSGKTSQVLAALYLELYLDKESIMVQYLNRLPYGPGIVGIEAASQRFFNKPNLDLSLAEAAFLAGLPQSPSQLDPFKNFWGAKQRQEYVLKRMYETGKISRESFELALAESVNLQTEHEQLKAMHFTDYVLSLNPPPGDITTTLDLNLNNQIQRIIRDHVRAFQNQGLTNAAALVLDNRDGAILAMVGSSDYWNGEEGMVNGTLARRQPGSTLKPFSYGLAFERGFTPATVIADVETEYLGSDDKLYIPQNYSGKYYGPVLLREALGRSLNIPAVKLANAVGIDVLLKTLRLIGFSLEKETEYYGLGLTLGNGEVTLLELAQGYAMLARRGLTCKANPFLDDDLKRLVKGTPSRIFSPEICFLLTDILTDEDLRIQAFGMNNPLLLEFPMAIKTGTSDDWRDNWVIGYTEKYTIAVWAGNFKGFPMNQMSGSIGAGPLFNKIAQLVITRGSNPELPAIPIPPAGVEKIIVCKLSGNRPTQYCDHVQAVYVLKEGAPRPYCDVHRKIRIDKRTGLLASEKCPRKFVVEKVFAFLPPIYGEWQAGQGMTHPPLEYSPLSPAKGLTADALVILKPRRGDIYLIEPGYDLATQTLELSGEVDPPLSLVSWIIDGKTVARVGWPYNASWPLQKGKHSIMMANGKKKSDLVYFEVR
jgi:penicillin-binding protein 1C